MSSRPDRPNTEVWDRCRGVIRSSKGGWFPGKGVFNHGYDMMHELVGLVSYMQVIILNATGRLPSPEIAKWCEAAFICVSWPDPRIWCNHIGALAGSVGCTPVAATAAGSLASDSIAYGPRTLAYGLEFIRSARKKQLDGYSVKDIVMAECRIKGKTPVIIGYARPVAKGDERVDALERTARKLGFSVGPHLALAYEIEKYMLDNFGESMNMSGFGSGFLADLDFNFTPDEVYRVSSCLISSGVTACYGDASVKVAGTFLPMYCDDVEYQGIKPRSVPEK